MTQNHCLKEIDDRLTQCVACEITWMDLTDKDKEMLSTRGKCIGEKEQWRRCKVNGMYCLGIRPEHKECVYVPFKLREE